LLFSFLSYFSPPSQTPHDDFPEPDDQPASQSATPPSNDTVMEGPRGILRLSNELLKDILYHLARDPEKCVSVDHRWYLSIESFKRPGPPDPPPLSTVVKNGVVQEDLRTDVDRFREVCKRFAELGAAHKFSRVVVRFSIDAFKKLDMLSNHPRLARHTRSFTYIIRSFYVEGDKALSRF